MRDQCHSVCFVHAPSSEIFASFRKRARSESNFYFLHCFKSSHISSLIMQPFFGFQKSLASLIDLLQEFHCLSFIASDQLIITWHALDKYLQVWRHTQIEAHKVAPLTASACKLPLYLRHVLCWGFAPK